jgi:alanine racemase
MRHLIIDLAAISQNLTAMRDRLAPKTNVMAVVKANAYGHGMVEVASHLQDKVDYFGVADIDEALQLRAAGIETKILAWLHSAGENFEAAVDTEIDLGIATVAQLNRVAEAARLGQRTASVHLKVDTGLGRNGATAADWPELVTTAKALAELSLIRVVAVFSHLSSTGEAEDLAQIDRFNSAVETAKNLGLEFEMRHLTASDGSLNYPQAHFEMVRIGVALYGLSPFTDHTSGEYGLRPAMTAKSEVVQTKRVAAGEGVSYGYLHRTPAETTLALIPVGYAEGLPRNVSGIAEVAINGKRYRIQSRIAMDQFVVDVGDDEISVGDEVIIFGAAYADGNKDIPTADQLAQAADTINYEIVTRMGGRFVRKYVG